MDNDSTLVELTGYIQVLEETGGSYDSFKYVEFTLFDTEGRLLALEYRFEDWSVARNIYKSLKEGMKVKVQIKGPIEKTKANYKGIGIIHIIEK